MNRVLYPANERGHFDFGWLNTFHTFSFGQYYDPSRMGFGALRVFNDDTVVAGSGFGTHPHKNMEIISIPLEGLIMHKDSMGHAEGIRPGEIQVMSAGSGITHSEYNGSPDEELKFLQIWILPNQVDVQPRYDQANIGSIELNSIKPIVGPQGVNTALWIHQQAYLSIGRTANNSMIKYDPLLTNAGVFIFVIDGSLVVKDGASNVTLSQRDGLGIAGATSLCFATEHTAYFIAIEVPFL